MRIPFPVIGAIQFMAALLWAGVVVFSDAALDPTPALLLASGLLLLATVALAGLAVGHGRWAWRLGLGVIGLEALTAALTPTSTWWWVALVFMAVSLSLTVGPWMTPHVRQLPPPAPLPGESMGLMIGLLAFPTALALTNEVDAWVWALAIAAVIVAWAYGRALVAGLWAARLALIPLAIVVAWNGGLWRAAVALGGTAALTFLAWTPGARNPVIPLDPRQVTASPVFPELAPKEVLDAAGYDERGRPRS